MVLLVSFFFRSFDTNKIKSYGTPFSVKQSLCSGTVIKVLKVLVTFFLSPFFFFENVQKAVYTRVICSFLSFVFFSLDGPFYTLFSSASRRFEKDPTLNAALIFAKEEMYSAESSAEGEMCRYASAYDKKISWDKLQICSSKRLINHEG